MRSSDGINWEVTEQHDEVVINQVARTPLGLLAVGKVHANPAIFMLTDTGRWRPRHVDRSSTESDYETIAVAGEVVYVGGGSGAVVASSDGLTWSELKETEEDYTLGFRETDILGDSMYWISGDGKLYRTPDVEIPVEYQMVAPEGGVLRSLAVGGDIAVAVGKKGTILRGKKK
jgi:photosystem II stability/assembly factor-like uncharacterized protein